MKFIKYIFFLIANLSFFVVAMICSFFLPVFAETRYGPGNNNSSIEIAPRLPTWLYWFDTTDDNSLWGDIGWREKHCSYWQSYFGMVRWLQRNPGCGFNWSVLSTPANDNYQVSHSSQGLDLDKSHSDKGWFYISNDNSFHFRWVKRIGSFVFAFETGWLLDIYVKEPSNLAVKPKASFIFHPQLKFRK